MPATRAADARESGECCPFTLHSGSRLWTHNALLSRRMFDEPESPSSQGSPDPDRADAIRREFADAWGSVGSRWGVPPATARVHGYLLAHRGPLTERQAHRVPAQSPDEECRMEGLSPLHLIIVLVIAVLVLGPGKLPEVGAALGKTIREFRKATTDVQESVRLDAPPEQA